MLCYSITVCVSVDLIGFSQIETNTFAAEVNFNDYLLDMLHISLHSLRTLIECACRGLNTQTESKDPRYQVRLLRIALYLPSQSSIVIIAVCRFLLEETQARREW